MQAYCVKCRTKREMKDAKSITMKNGKPATQGVCPTCGTKMFRIGKGQKLGSGNRNNGGGWHSSSDCQPLFYDYHLMGNLANKVGIC